MLNIIRIVARYSTGDLRLESQVFVSVAGAVIQLAGRRDGSYSTRGFDSLELPWRRADIHERRLKAAFVRTGRFLHGRNVMSPLVTLHDVGELQKTRERVMGARVLRARAAANAHQWAGFHAGRDQQLSTVPRGGGQPTTGAP
jgi:hypothetical protein